MKTRDCRAPRHRHVTAVAIIAIAAFVGPADTTEAADWTEIGPAPITSGPYTGRCSAIAASPTNTNKYYVAGASGGVWRTLDGGATWTPLTDHMPTNAIGALALDPTDDNIVYAGSGEANFANHSFYGLGLYKSVDGGDTWVVLAADTFGGRTFSRIVIPSHDPQVLFASIMHAGGFPARNAAKGHPGVDGPVGVFRSTDGGANWAQLAGGLPATAASDLWIDPLNTNVLYAAIGDIFGPPENGIYKSIDGGDTWTKLAGGLPTSSNGRISLAVAPSDGQRIYAMITNPANSNGGSATTKGVYRSDDGGSTWIARSPGNIQASYGWYLSTMIVDPLNSDTVFAGGLSMVRSTNGGASWTFITPPHVDMHGLAYDASHRLLSANDGGLFRSANNGSSWISISNNLGVVQFYAGLSVHPSNETFVLGGTQDNGTNRRDGPSNWTRVFGGDGGYTAVHPSTPNSMFAEFQGTGNLLFSSDGGESFQYRDNGISGADRNCFLPPMSYFPSSSTTLLYGTHRVYRTTDTGLNWSAISGDLTGGAPAAIRALVLAPSNDQTVYASTNDGRVLVSLDGGANWDLTRTGVPGWPRVTREIAVDPADDATAYLAVSQFGVDQILRTTNHGTTWTPIDGNLPDIPVNTVAVHRDGDNRFVFLGTDNGVFLAVGDETNWSPYGAGLPHSPTIDLVVDVNHQRVVASTMGRGMWTIALPPACLADIDGDGGVGPFDLALLLGNWGPNPGHPADLDHDGAVGPFDLALLLGNWGPCSP